MSSNKKNLESKQTSKHLNQKEIEYAKKIMESIDKSPTSFHAVETNCKILEKNKYIKLDENKIWNLEYGGKYYVTRNNSALIAFKIPKSNEINNFTFLTSHTDYPTLKLKHYPETNIEDKYKILNAEIYGGAIYHTWFDVPLSVAGRILIKTKAGIKTKLVNIDKDLLMITSVAKHQHRDVNDGFKINPQVDMLPLYGNGTVLTLNELLAKKYGIDVEDIIDTELFVYRKDKGSFFGANNEFVASRSIDDQACVFCSLYGLLEAQPVNNIPVHAIFDNEEIGSTTRQGAASTFLKDVVYRIGKFLDLDEEEFLKLMSNSFGVMADNAHALHPNHPETTDPNVRPYMGGGIVVKYSSSFNYTTDGISAAITKRIAKKGNVKTQEFFNRSDYISGAALGRFLVPTLSPISADIGLAQLGMHSTRETCSTQDLLSLKEFAKTLFSTSIKQKQDGEYIIN